MSKNFQYPVSDGTRETFEKEWYVALGFGDKQDYGYHEGVDINLKTGGDTDNGQSLKAISDWELTYYHLNSHNESGFGVHFVYKVNSPFGVRWIHYAHCQKPIDPEKKSSGQKGDKLAEIDKTGRPRFILPAHLHLAVFKVDPFNLPNKIDTIAKTKTQLNDWWEDPIAFFQNWDNYKEEAMDIKQLATDLRIGLLDYSPSEDELKWDIEHWENPKEFIKRITGDEKFYKKYVLPQLESQKIAQESGCKSEKEAIEASWQTKLESAKKEYQDALKKKLENTTIGELINLIVVKFKESFNKGGEQS